MIDDELGVEAPVDVIAEAEETPEVAADDASPLSEEEMALLEEFSPVVEAEYHRLLELGLPEGEETQQAAWTAAMQQAEQVQQAVQDGVRAQLEPYLETMAPAIFSHDVQTVLAQEPVQGVTAEDLAAQIREAGISPLEWATAEPERKQQFIVAAARQVAYENLVSGRTAPTAPPQDAPGVLREQGTRPAMDPGWERQVSQLAETLGLTHEQAAEVLRGS